MPIIVRSSLCSALPTNWWTASVMIEMSCLGSIKTLCFGYIVACELRLRCPLWRKHHCLVLGCRCLSHVATDNEDGRKYTYFQFLHYFKFEDGAKIHII